MQEEFGQWSKLELHNLMAHGLMEQLLNQLH
jgi:hypothetical protein